MRYWLLFGLVAVLAAGCAGKAATPVPDVLQRLDGSRVELAAVTLDANRIALDAAYLRNAMSAGLPVRTRSAAVVVKRDARRLMPAAARAARVLRALPAAKESRVVHHYVSLMLAALNAQWLEGQRLAFLCDLATVDPLALDRRDQRHLAKLSSAARWFAWQSVLAVRAANRWEALHLDSFRYHPVRTPMPTRKGE